MEAFMKKTTLAMILLSCAAAPVFAQGVLPQCEISNFDAARGLFTISGTDPNMVNQQCLLTVNPKQTSAAGAQFPATYFVEGEFNIEISAGGGGGGAGATLNQGGGGGGAGAKLTKTTNYLAAGVYKLTIGAGGVGGNAPTGALATDGNPSSLTRYSTGELVAGFAGADLWTSRTTVSSKSGSGGVPAGGTSGGDGGGSGTTNEAKAQEVKAEDGGRQSGKSLASAGKAGGETVRAQANAGGGGGAGAGHGGDGQSSGFKSNLASAGVLGGGGGGGRGGMFTARSGAAGGDGFIRITQR
jgi:hypothetical protein